MALTKVIYVDGTTKVHAANLNAMQDEIIANGNKVDDIGTLSNLVTTDKSDIVSAINEVAGDTGDSYTYTDDGSGNITITKN